MNYVYYKSEIGNFGDDLNMWLWPKLFHLSNQINSDCSFFGIGSLLSSESDIIKKIGKNKKIVFGTGIRPSYIPFTPDDSWNIKFVRGPLSALILKNKYDYIADGAYAIRLLNDFSSYINVKKEHHISVMPYFRSVKYFNWKLICRQLGFNYISPLSESGIEHTLKEIASSELLITESLHGAIVADLLRTPWSRFVLSTPHTEGGMVSEFKWLDWLSSVDIPKINTAHIKFYRKSFLNNLIKKITFDTVHAEFLAKPVVRHDILSCLSTIANYYLSSDTVIQNIDSRINEKIFELKDEGVIPTA